MNEYQRKWARRDRAEKRSELYGSEMRRGQYRRMKGPSIWTDWARGVVAGLVMAMVMVGVVLLVRGLINVF